MKTQNIWKKLSSLILLTTLSLSACIQSDNTKKETNQPNNPIEAENPLFSWEKINSTTDNPFWADLITVNAENIVIAINNKIKLDLEETESSFNYFIQDFTTDPPKSLFTFNSEEVAILNNNQSITRENVVFETLTINEIFNKSTLDAVYSTNWQKIAHSPYLTARWINDNTNTHYVFIDLSKYKENKNNCVMLNTDVCNRFANLNNDYLQKTNLNWKNLQEDYLTQDLVTSENQSKGSNPEYAKAIFGGNVDLTNVEISSNDSCKNTLKRTLNLKDNEVACFKCDSSFSICRFKESFVDNAKRTGQLCYNGKLVKFTRHSRTLDDPDYINQEAVGCFVDDEYKPLKVVDTMGRFLCNGVCSGKEPRIIGACANQTEVSQYPSLIGNLWNKEHNFFDKKTSASIYKTTTIAKSPGFECGNNFVAKPMAGSFQKNTFKVYVPAGVSRVFIDRKFDFDKTPFTCDGDGLSLDYGSGDFPTTNFNQENFIKCMQKDWDLSGIMQFVVVNYGKPSALKTYTELKNYIESVGKTNKSNAILPYDKRYTYSSGEDNEPFEQGNISDISVFFHSTMLDGKMAKNGGCPKAVNFRTTVPTLATNRADGGYLYVDNYNQVGRRFNIAITYEYDTGALEEYDFYNWQQNNGTEPPANVCN